MRRHPVLAFAPAIVLAIAGLALGYARPPTYKATAELAVGQIDVSDPAAVGSVVQASQSLAVVYSRMIFSTGVERRVRRRLGEEASGSISATPIPGSPLVRVTGTGDSSKEAVHVANVAAHSLLDYAETYDSTSAQEAEIAKRFRKAAVRVTVLTRRVGKLGQAAFLNPTKANRRRAAVAKAQLEDAKLRRETLRLDFATSTQTGRNGPALRLFSIAESASSDRESLVQVLGLIGLLAGLALGAALATARMNRRMARLVRG